MQKTLLEDVAVLKEQVREIKENHLVHLQDAIDKVDQKVESGFEKINDRFFWLIGVLILGTLISIVMKLFRLG